MDMCVNQTKAETNETQKNQETHLRVYTANHRNHFPMFYYLLVKKTVTMC